MNYIEWVKANDIYQYEFVSIEQQLRRNGDRHLERAIAYASAQYPEHYYQGSMKKALKWYKKANLYKIDDPLLRSMIEYVGGLLNKHIEDCIMQGDKNVRNA